MSPAREGMGGSPARVERVAGSGEITGGEERRERKIRKRKKKEKRKRKRKLTCGPHM